MAEFAQPSNMAVRRSFALDRGVSVSGRLSVTMLPPAARVALRAPDASLPALSAALGLDLPRRPGHSAASGSRFALWLGPDEWLVVDEAGGDPLGDCRDVSDVHSAVEISHRNVAFLVAGQGADAALNAACPRNLSLEAFPVGACSRTILGKIEIVLFRQAEDAFRVECWRSFAGYAQELLAVSVRDAA